MSAVVFDCDGVLVDSEGLIAEVWAGELAQHGVAVAPGDAAALRGRTDPDCYAYFAARAELPPWPVFDAAVRAATARRLPGELRAFPDAADAVAALALQGLPLAVASSSPRWRLDLALTISGLGRYFDLTVAGDEVAEGKPAPDLYLAAAAGLGLDPARCLAVEDAAAGADAAAAAGMRVVVVQRPDAPLVPGRATVSELDAEMLLTWLGR